MRDADGNDVVHFWREEDVEVPQNQGYILGGPYHKDYSILGSILGSTNLWKLPFINEEVQGFGKLSC